MQGACGVRSVGLRGPALNSPHGLFLSGVGKVVNVVVNSPQGGSESTTADHHTEGLAFGPHNRTQRLHELFRSRISESSVPKWMWLCLSAYADTYIHVSSFLIINIFSAGILGLAVEGLGRMSNLEHTTGCSSKSIATMQHPDQSVAANMPSCAHSTPLESACKGLLK